VRRLVFADMVRISEMGDVSDGLVGAATDEPGPKCMTMPPELGSIQACDLHKLRMSADFAEVGAGGVCFMQLFDSEADELAGRLRIHILLISPGLTDRCQRPDFHVLLRCESPFHRTRYSWPGTT
jgi:hypothetical protein